MQTLVGRKACVEKFCKDVRKEAGKYPPIGWAKAGRPEVARELTNDESKTASFSSRLPLPKHFRQVNLNSKQIEVTASAKDVLRDLGTIDFGILARRNVTFIVEIELLNGNYYEDFMKIFSRTMKFAIERPDRDVAQYPPNRKSLKGTFMAGEYMKL